MFESRISAGATEKIYQGGKNLTPRLLCGPTTWKDMLKNALRDTANWQIKETEQLYKVSSLCLDDHHFKKEELGSVGELSKVCSQIVLTCLYLARIGRLDILWSVNKLAPAVTKISYIHHTNDYRPYCHMENTAQHCRLGLFHDSDFAGGLEDSKSTSGGSYVFLEALHLSP